MQLAEKRCKPLEGSEKPFTIEEAEKYLDQVSNWSLVDDSIQKEFEFDNFRQALNFVDKVGEVAEKEQHHPDIGLHSYKKVKVTLSTHMIKGLSENDFILAAKIDKLISEKFK